eukprot:5071669-Alexandrium_andersonii.AAC.1
MSASLVGSEMCIRDSQDMVEPPYALLLDHCQRGVRRGRDHEPGQGPVSYTHLTLPTICSV